MQPLAGFEILNGMQDFGDTLRETLDVKSGVQCQPHHLLCFYTTFNTSLQQMCHVFDFHLAHGKLSETDSILLCATPGSADGSAMPLSSATTPVLGFNVPLDALVTMLGRAGFLPSLAVFPVDYMDDDMAVFEFPPLSSKIAINKLPPPPQLPA
jgi:hypothetical protein